jgi:tRNA modification GTPase
VDVCAAVMTGPGTGAIATIQLFGASAEAVLREIFQRKGGRVFEWADGRVLLGSIVDDGETVDEVTVGCEGPGSFAIHCHGNPLLVERIMGLLRHCGVQPVPAEQLLARMLTVRKPCDSIKTEARLALTTVKTIEGAAIIVNQMNAGLSQKTRQWREHLHSTSLAEIAADARQILEDSEPARLIISGCTIALVGPPNTGKSTLLNALAGREKAIVTAFPGTTRDWVSTEIHIPPLLATLIDTAGLDPSLAAGAIDRAAQRKSIETLERADLALLVLDLSQPAGQIDPQLMNSLSNRRTVVVLNKADLPAQFDSSCLPQGLGERIPVSAKLGTGIDSLIRDVCRACNVAESLFDRVIAFTDRQKRLLSGLQHAGSRSEAVSTITELLEGPIPV